MSVHQIVMAEPSASEPAAPSSQMVEASEEQPGHSLQNGTSENAPTSQDVATTSFQAVNVKAVTENASTSMNTAAQGSQASASVPTPPPNDAAGTHNAPQTAQTSSEPSETLQPPALVDGVADAMSADITTYGTRSRNRTGTSRPNYAEDQDMDFEISSAATTKKKQAAESATSTGSKVSETKQVARHALGTGGAGNTNESSGKESTPGVTSKKRKAAGAPTITQTPPAANSPAPTAIRKPAASGSSARETNIMSFSKHRSCLNKKGELVADDGTRLSANGTSTILSPLIAFEVPPYPAV